MEYQAEIKCIESYVDNYVDEHNTKKEAIAERIGISRTAFYQKLGGKSEFSIFEAYRMAQLFGCTVDDLLTKPIAGTS